MVKIPNKVKIGSTTFKVEKTKEELDGGAMGRTYFTRSLIQYQAGVVAEEQQITTVLHEALHSIIFVYGLHRALKLNEENEEILVSLLEQPLMSFIKNNPQLIKAIQES